MRASFTRPEQLNDQVRRLNLVRDEYLSTEWEIGLLNAFSKVGEVQHEPNLGGKRLIDLLFESANGFEFAADIVTVSDQQLHKRNPVYPLWQELGRQVRKRQVKTGGFGLAVGHDPESFRGRGVRHSLLLPPVGKFSEQIFNAAFDAFIAKVRESPAQARVHSVRNATTDVTIHYKPDANGIWTSSHLSYTCANIIDDNPLFNSLKEKARKLKASNYDGPRGVFVCDGGCRMLTTRMNHWSEYRLDDVVPEFFRQHQSVAFVVTIGLHHDNSPWVGRGRFRPELHAWIKRPEFQALDKPLQAIIKQMMQHLPVVETSGENALGHLKAKVSWGAHFGGLEMTGDKIKMSAITILQLLAGKLDYDTFARAHGFDQQLGNPFARAIDGGRVIAQCSIDQTPDEDDDWITFEFSEPDPALAAFKSPAAKATES